MNEICTLHAVDNAVLTPAEARVVLTVAVTDLLGDLEIKGRLVGPRCAYSTTVEVGYTLRPFPRQPARPTFLTAEVIIPEPNLWEPPSPFLYQGPLEVWRRGKKWWATNVSHGLRVLKLSRRGLSLNGRPWPILGIERGRFTSEEAKALRQSACNTLMLPVTADTADLWDAADHFGFLVIGRLQNTPSSYRVAAALRLHPCHLGWVLPDELPASDSLAGAELARLREKPGSFGMQVLRPLTETECHTIDFICCYSDQLETLERIARPKIVLQQEWPSADDHSRFQTTARNILGWIKR